MKRIFLLTFLTLLMQSAMQASTWTVSNSGNTFTITRSSSDGAETISYRTVNLSAFAGQHYTAASGELTFTAGQTSRTVTVSETGSTLIYSYAYQNTTTRSYRFEVLDANGFQLAYCDRSFATGTYVYTSVLYSEKTSSDISQQIIRVTDKGYNQTGMPYKVSSSTFYDSGQKRYLKFLDGVELRMTLELHACEVDDGYQYVQILVDDESNYDVCPSGNGNPGTPNYSRYLACFEIKSGSKDTDTHRFTFPVTSVSDNAGADNPWSLGTGYNLVVQKFKTSCRASDGKLIIPKFFSTLVFRYDASGNGGDDWDIKLSYARITAIDTKAPTVLTSTDISVNGGVHINGNDFYISVPFSEIVTVTGTPTLTTTWGTASYLSGSGSNVLTFKGTINASAGTTLAVSSFSGTVKDLYGNKFNGTVSKTFTGIVSAWPSYTLAQNADNSALLTAISGQTANVTLTRTLNVGGWNTFCAPFNINSTQLASVFGTGTKVRLLDSSSFDEAAKHLTLSFTNASSIEAGKPYLVYIGNASAVSNPTFTDVTVSSQTTTTSTTYADFIPVMSPTQLTGGDKTVLFVTGGNQLTYPNSTSNINGFRAYFLLKDDAVSSARSFEMTFDDGETTGIQMIGNTGDGTAGTLYDLTGRKCGQPSGKGIFIERPTDGRLPGKKVIIK